MDNRNRFFVVSVTLMIWASGIIAPDIFVSTVYADKPSSVQNVTVTNTPSNPVPVIIQGAPGSSTRTLVEIISPTVTVGNLPVYTVPAGHRLTLTDVIIAGSCGPGNIFRDAVLISQGQNHSYQSGIEFGEGHVVGVGVQSPGICGNGAGFFELRGYLEAL